MSETEKYHKWVNLWNKSENSRSYLKGQVKTNTIAYLYIRKREVE